MHIDRVRGILNPHHEQLAACYTAGWERWTQEIAPVFQRPTSKLRARAVYDLATEEAQMRFADLEDVEVLERHESVWLRFQGLLLARFKKIDSAGRTRNNPTPESLRLEAQQLDLPGFEALGMVTVGYFLDPTGTSLDSVSVVYAVNNVRRWSYDLDLAGTVTRADIVLPFDATPLAEPEVNPREGLIPDEQDEEGQTE